MPHFDVFNGDADGLCALQQLRLAQPREARLVTGPKRDIALLERVPAVAGDTLTVLDISLHRNRAALQDLLARGATVEYFDHHFAGEVASHPRLRTHLDPSAGVCTSLLVDRHLQGAHRGWAIVGAFGDNLPDVACRLAASAGLMEEDTRQLRQLGEAINYNAYGDSEADLMVPPWRLATLLRPFHDPLVFARSEPVARTLAEGQAADLEAAWRIPPERLLPGAALVLLPDAPWARRVQGVFANALSQRHPDRAHAVLRAAGDADFVVSVRAPRQRPQGADQLCLGFGSGGGRSAAAGIDRLPSWRLEEFAQAFARAFAT
ncbi:MAG TPA: acetyltransferase [Ramlibacter sp.]|nr:acetyltransferase [Ramlibacter sp.]